MTHVKLWSWRACPFAQRARIVLAEKRVEHEVVECDLMDKPDELFAVNRKGAVPVLAVDDERPVTESGVVCRYIDEVFAPAGSMAGRTPHDRAEEGMIMAEIDSRVVPALYGHLRAQGEDVERTKLILDDALSAMEMWLGRRRASPFFGGEVLSLADAHFLPFLHRIVRAAGHWKGYSLPAHLPKPPEGHQ